MAARAQPLVKRLAGVATVALAVLCVIIYGEGFVASAGSHALLTQLVFYGLVTVGAYALAYGLPQDRRSALGLGVCTRYLAAAFVLLSAVAGNDERAIELRTYGHESDVDRCLNAARDRSGEWARSSVRRPVTAVL